MTLTAIGVNQVLGGAVFLMLALLAVQLGNWSIWAVPLTGLLAMCVALCRGHGRALSHGRDDVIRLCDWLEHYFTDCSSLASATRPMASVW